MPVDVALASCLTLPEPDPDAAPLAAALSAAGISHGTFAWDDPDVDWSQFKLVVLRSTWNYCLHRDAFLDWIDRVDAVARLENPADVLRWNTHKGYLAELAAAGVDTAPTELVRRGPGDLIEICARRGWSDVVAKPAVSAGSYLTFRMSPSATDAAKFDQLAAERDMLVQPFVESVSDYGERSVVVIEGEITHAIRKNPRFGGEDESVDGPMSISDAERALAEAALAAVPKAANGTQNLLYARVDMAPSASGKPMVMELELAEPSLFFDMGREALTRFTQGIASRLEQAT